VTKRFYWAGSLEDPEFADFLLQIGREHGLEGWMLVAAQDDAVSTVSQHRDELATIFRPTTPAWDVVRWAVDKRLTDRMARELKVPYPRTWYPAGEGDLSDLEGLGSGFPVIIKPAISIRMQHSARIKALPADNVEELGRQYRIATGLVHPEEIMVQEIIPGGGETQVSVATLCIDGKISQAMTARRRRQYPIDYGLGSSFVESINLPELLGPAECILEYMHASGMVEVEFKQDPRDGVYKLLDINIRPWGWHTLCIACGLDLPYMQYRHMLGEVLPTVAPRYGTRWIRVATDLPAGVQEIRAGITTPWKFLSSLVGHNTYSVLSWRDPLPVFGDMGALLSRAAHHSPRYKEAYV
jgi:predicted ATP-grasp superfamily ATP-dependent carboligase